MRDVMKFLIPVTTESLGRNDLVGRASIPVYINPQRFVVNKQKNINSTLTKAGFAIQYWGEQLTTLSVSGTAGSGGIEAINILDSVYRNEIIRFNELLLERATILDTTTRTALQDTSTANLGNGLVSILDEFTNGGVTNIIDGTKSAIDSIIDAANGIATDNPTSTTLIPTIGSFATSIIIYWQGVKYMGFFESFNFSEEANSAGHFDYDFSFVVIKQTGTRKNFMPWHRNPYDASGTPRPASLPIEGARPDELSIDPHNETSRLPPSQIFSTFSNLQSGTKQPDQVPINRNAILKGK